MKRILKFVSKKIKIKNVIVVDVVEKGIESNVELDNEGG